MNYSLQILKGRSAVNTLKLADGVNSIGRHDDCLIRIRSSQVSRRHCEILTEGETLVLRDLGSSNGTFVNGKRVLGKQVLNPGDVLTIGGVTLRLDQLGAGAAPKPAPHDTAEIDALPAAEEDLELELVEEEEFEIAIEEEPAPEHIDIIPLEDEPPAAAPRPSAKVPPGAAQPEKAASKANDALTTLNDDAPKPKPPAEEEDAVAQFLMDLKLDEDE